MFMFSTPPTVFEKSIAEITVSLQFSIKFEVTFDNNLLDRTSAFFSHFAAKYTTTLTQAFSSTIGFQYITIDRFWPGSVGVDYTVHYNHFAFENAKELTEQLSTNVTDKLYDLPFVNADFLNATWDAEVTSAGEILQQVAQNPCTADPCQDHPFYNCSVGHGRVLCTSPCDGYHCGPFGAACFLDSAGAPKCRCPADDEYVYGGERCDQRAEKLDLSSNTIIAIASGLGGGLVFILLVVLAVTCFRRRRRMAEGQKLHSEHSDSFNSITGMNRVAGPIDGLGQGTSARFYREQPGDITSFLQNESGSPTDTDELAHFRSEFYQRESAKQQRNEGFLQIPSGFYSSASPLTLSAWQDYEISPPAQRHTDTRDIVTSQLPGESGAEATVIRDFHRCPDEIYFNMSQEKITIQRPQVSTEPAPAL